MIHRGSRLIALHLIRLAFVALSLLESCALVAALVSKVTACLGIALVYHICLKPFIRIKVFFFVLVKVMSIDLIIEFMSSSTSTKITTRSNPSVVTDLGLLGKERSKLAQSDLV